MSNLVVDTQKEQFLEAFKVENGVCSSEEKNQAIQRLDELPLPTTREENWKYTRTTRITKTSWKNSDAGSKINIEDYRIEGLDCDTFVFVNGLFCSELSSSTELGKGIGLAINSEDNSLLQNLGTGLSKEDFFSSFNTAFATDGISLSIPKNTCLDKPIHLIHIGFGEDNAAVYRHKVKAGTTSGAHLIQSFICLDNNKNFCNSITDVEVGQNSSLSIDKLQKGGTQSFFLNRENITQDADSRFTINTCSAKALWVRNDIDAELNGQNSTCNLYGVYLPKEKDLVDNHTIIDHKVPHCDSNEHYKGIIYDKATGVFNGKVFVRVDAQKTNAFQQNANILMSDDASMNSKPELEIYADDVKCSHGSTTGQFDEDAVFYLKARGINEFAARELLVDAFLAEVTSEITSEEVAKHFNDFLRA